MNIGLQSAVRAYHQVCKADLRDQLILNHLSFVRHILGRMLGTLPEYVDSENLESAGILGLVEAAGQFDPSRNVAFTTFAYRRIKGAILDELRRNCPLPQKMLQQWARIRAVSHQIELPLTAEKIAAVTHMSVEQVEECLAAMRLTRPENWTDELCEVPNRGDQDQEAESESSRREQCEILADAIAQLPETARTAVIMYHYEDMRMKEIGEALDLSESRVCRILADAELRLKTSVIRMMRES
jgi:RNA polymerase sigma factor for flagellar operon FliA